VAVFISWKQAINRIVDDEGDQREGKKDQVKNMSIVSLVCGKNIDLEYEKRITSLTSELARIKELDKDWDYIIGFGYWFP